MFTYDHGMKKILKYRRTIITSIVNTTTMVSAKDQIIKLIKDNTINWVTVGLIVIITLLAIYIAYIIDVKKDLSRRKKLQPDTIPTFDKIPLTDFVDRINGFKSTIEKCELDYFGIRVILKEFTNGKFPFTAEHTFRGKNTTNNDIRHFDLLLSADYRSEVKFSAYLTDTKVNLRTELIPQKVSTHRVLRVYFDTEVISSNSKFCFTISSNWKDSLGLKGHLFLDNIYTKKTNKASLMIEKPENVKFTKLKAGIYEGGNLSSANIDFINQRQELNINKPIFYAYYIILFEVNVIEENRVINCTK